MIEKISKSCCFTGHRPEKLTADPQQIKAALAKEIDAAIADGITEFISGMARGVDLWAAELVILRKKNNPSIRLFCAIPYEGFDKKWAEEYRKLYKYIISNADGLKIFYPNFTYASFHQRNRWMVDRSSFVIAVFNGEKGGTKNTLDYAAKKGIRIVMIKG